MVDRFVVLGIHKEGRVPGVKGGDVARVRMFVGKNLVDQDFKLVKLMPGVPDTVEIHAQMIAPAVEKRLAELQALPPEGIAKLAIKKKDRK